MTELEEKSLQIADKYYSQYSLVDKVKYLANEVVELAIGIANNDEENVKEELGDCIWILLHIAVAYDKNQSLDKYVMQAANKTKLRYESGQRVINAP